MKLVKLGQQPKKLYNLRLYVVLYISFENITLLYFRVLQRKSLEKLLLLSMRLVQELENSANLFMKTKVGVAHALDEMKGAADHEAPERIALFGKYNNLEHNVDSLSDEMANLKLQARLSDSQNMIKQLNQKLVQFREKKGPTSR